MDPAAVFDANLGLIDSVIAAVCRRARLYGADAEDFASTAKLALMENDHAVLRKWEGRSALGTYLTVVLQRLLANERTRERGRWHASAGATRMGPAAVLLETLLRRDRRSLEEAVPLVRNVDPTMTREEIVVMADRIRERAARPRIVPLDAEEHAIPSSERADARTAEREAREVSHRAARTIRETLASFTGEEQAIVRLRFRGSMSVTQIARSLALPHRTLYRRLEELLDRLRRALAAQQIDATAIDDIIAFATEEDFDPGARRTGSSDPSNSVASSEEAK